MEAIDLGLSVKWADRNLGANSPDEVGTFYAWAETSSKNDYSWETYEDMIDQGKYGPYKESHFKSGLFKIDSGHDAMTLKFGHPWRIPTLSFEILWFQYKRCLWLTKLFPIQRTAQMISVMLS